MKFVKYSATGNDFIVIDDRGLIFDWKNTQIITQLCHRKNGIGADGILLLQKPKKNEDFSMVILNADGSRPSMCGNGTRAIVHFAHHYLALREDCDYQFSTDNSLYTASIKDDEVRVLMSEQYDQRVFEKKLYNDALTEFFINTGVPHLLLEVEDVHVLDLCQLAPYYRSLPEFQNGTNVSIFHRSDDKKKLARLRTYERGVEGETLACGTAVMACSLSLRYHYGWSGKIDIETNGGMLSADLQADSMYFSGGVKAVFQGQTCDKKTS